MKRTLLLALTAIILLAACKKDSKDPSLVGNWSLVNIVYKMYIGGNMVYSSDDPGNGATVEFQKDGKAVFKEGGSQMTVNYTINGPQVTIDGDIYEIKNLTNSSVTLYNKDESGVGNYEEETINLKR